VAERVVFVNGSFVHERDACISVFDHGLLYGDGAFDTAVAWKGQVFRLEQHLDRLFKSLAYLRIEPPYDRDALRTLILETIRRNDLDTAYVKCVITRGVTPTPLMDVENARPGCVIFAQPYLSMVDDERRRHGLKLKTSALRRPGGDSLDSRVKSLNYLSLVLAKIEAVGSGADNAILASAKGEICEGAGFNIFAVHETTLLTPVDDALGGITRGAVIDVALRTELCVRETSLTLYDLYTADEVFVTSTAGGVIAVASVDSRPIGKGSPGPIFEMISRGYQELLETPGEGTPIGV